MGKHANFHLCHLYFFITCKHLTSEVRRSRPHTRQNTSNRRAREKPSPKHPSTEQTMTEVTEQQDADTEVPDGNDNPETTSKPDSSGN